MKGPISISAINQPLFLFMCFSGQEELLTEHALQWNRKKIEKLPLSLPKQYSKIGFESQRYG